MFKTSKCSHGDKGMCINCMINKNKQEKKSTEGATKNSKLQCNHPSHMKCIRCITLEQTKDQCQHPDYQICKKCEHLLRYQKFSYVLQTLQNQCTHKKPCSKCVPALSRKNYFIDKTCKKHLPYPQALCDGCMAPTLTICKQKYAHISRVVIRTTSIYRIIQARVFGILLGKIMDDVVYVQDVYFPKQQVEGSQYINPQSIEHNNCIFELLGLQEVGLLYNSQSITGMSLMLSSLFQQKYLAIEQGHQISKFITMRLHMNLQENNQPHFECYMVSDQLQAFHKNNIIYEKESMENDFDLITAKSERLSQLPTFLREGVETDKLYFKEVIVWVIFENMKIPTIAEQNFKCQNQENSYPFYGLQNQNLESFKRYIHLNGQPFQKYRNIQFLLHLKQLVGKSVIVTFLSYEFQDHPDNFLLDIYYELQRKQVSKLKKMQRSF